MHEQEVTRIVFLANNLGYTCCHRYCRYTGRTNQRIGVAINHVHDLTEDYTTDSTKGEGYQA